MAIKGKRIFLTGGAGFIGVSLISKLIKDNEIIIYDNLRRDALTNTDLVKNKNLTLIKGDVLDSANLKKCIGDSNLVIHLAAIAGIDTVVKSVITTMKVNMIGTANVLEAAMILKKCERFVDFSTSEVFGTYCYNSGEGDSTNMGAVGEARWTYSVSKLSAEHLTYSYHKELGLPAVIIRPFNIYGPRQVGEGAIHHFIKRALSGLPIQIYGDGNRIRAWCYVDDLINGLLLCLENKDAIGQVFNIGNPRSTVTIYGLALSVLKASNSKSKIEFLPDSEVDIELRVPNIEKARKILGFNPQVELEEGLARTISWYKNFKND